MTYHFMNIHAPPSEIQEQFRCLEWLGKRYTKKGKTYIKARHRTMGWKMYYCFEDNFAWFPDCATKTFFAR